MYNDMSIIIAAEFKVGGCVSLACILCELHSECSCLGSGNVPRKILKLYSLKLNMEEILMEI